MIQKTSSIVNCPVCKEKFVPGLQRRITCFKCGFVFCKECQEKYHEEGNCNEKYIAERILDLEKMNDPEGISQCPRCRIPYIKDPECDKVTCINCKTIFCFKCCCLYQPTVTHDCSYHRPQCHHFRKNLSNEEIYKPEKCEECKKAGKLCPRPVNLRNPRRVDADEVFL